MNPGLKTSALGPGPGSTWCNRCSCIGPPAPGATSSWYLGRMVFCQILLALENCRNAYKSHCWHI